MFTCVTAGAAHQQFLALRYKFKMSHVNTDQSSLSQQNNIALNILALQPPLFSHLIYIYTDVLCLLHSHRCRLSSYRNISKKVIKKTQGGLEITLAFKRKYSTLYLYKSQGGFFHVLSSKKKQFFSFSLKCPQATALPHSPVPNPRSDPLLVDLKTNKARKETTLIGENT